MFSQLLNNRKGFTLIETLVAVLVFSAALVSLITIAGRGISATATAKDQMAAHFLAQEGIEVVRNIRDSNYLKKQQQQAVVWNSSLDQCEGVTCAVDYSTTPPQVVPCSGSSCVLSEDGESMIVQAGMGSPSRFTREIILELYGTDEYRVSSKVSWSAKDIGRSVTLQTLLKDWQTP